MSDKIIHIEEQRLNNKLQAFKEDLHTNYIIGKREIEQKGEIKFELKMDQYDLYTMQTHESYMTLTVFPDLGLVNVEFARSEIMCALALNPNFSIPEYESISIDKIESSITYILFTETDMYAND